MPHQLDKQLAFEDLDCVVTADAVASTGVEVVKAIVERTEWRVI